MLRVNQLIGFGAANAEVAPPAVPASYVFNGTDEYLTRTLSTSSPSATIYTISAWIKSVVVSAGIIIR